MTRQRRIAVTSPQTRLALAGRRTGVPAVPPHLAPADAERARRIHRREVRLGGIPVSWLAVAVLPYPVLALLARWQLRRAERTERPDRPPGVRE